MSSVTIYSTNKCYFSNDLSRVLENIGVNYIQLPESDGDCWTRDWAIPTPEHPEHKWLVTSKIATWRNLIFCAIYNAPLCNENSILGDRGTEMPKHLSCQDGRANHGQTAIDSLTAQMPRKVKQSARPIEGGNIIAAKNKDGQTIYIISDTVKSNEEHIYAIKSAQDSAYIKKRPEDRYAKIFGVDPSRIVFVQNVSYHLDLAMTDVGDGNILHNCLDTTSHRFLDQKDLFTEGQRNVYRKRVEHNVSVLTKAGFSVTKMCFNVIW